MHTKTKEKKTGTGTFHSISFLIVLRLSVILSFSSYTVCTVHDHQWQKLINKCKKFVAYTQKSIKVQRKTELLKQKRSKSHPHNLFVMNSADNQYNIQKKCLVPFMKLLAPTWSLITCFKTKVPKYVCALSTLDH